MTNDPLSRRLGLDVTGMVVVGGEAFPCIYIHTYIMVHEHQHLYLLLRGIYILLFCLGHASLFEIDI